MRSVGLKPSQILMMKRAAESFREKGMSDSDIADLVATGSVEESKLDLSLFGKGAEVYDGSEDFVEQMKKQSGDYDVRKDYEESGSRRSVATVAGLVALVGAGVASGATMSVGSWTNNNGYFQYLVENTSDASDDNNMVDFTLPAGLNQGVYGAVADNDWVSTIYGDSTVFDKPVGIDPLVPGDQAIFELYSNDLNIHQDYATATARGPPTGLQFEPVEVDVPGVPEPSTLAILGVGLAGLLGKYGRREDE